MATKKKQPAATGFYVATARCETKVVFPDALAKLGSRRIVELMAMEVNAPSWARPHWQQRFDGRYSVSLTWIDTERTAGD